MAMTNLTEECKKKIKHIYQSLGENGNGEDDNAVLFVYTFYCFLVIIRMKRKWLKLVTFWKLLQFDFLTVWNVLKCIFLEYLERRNFWMTFLCAPFPSSQMKCQGNNPFAPFVKIIRFVGFSNRIRFSLLFILQQ